jgi:hypothetical protein
MFAPAFHPAWMEADDPDDILARVLACVEKKPNGKGREVAWLAKKLGTTVQVVNNWKTRGIPPSRYADIAASIGWTVDQVIGAAEAPAGWPFETITPDRLAGLTPRQMAMIEIAALRELERIEAASGKPQPTAA